MGGSSSKGDESQETQLTDVQRSSVDGNDDDDHDCDETGREAARKFTDQVYRFEVKADRSCTDCFWLMLFLAFWVGMLAIAGVSASKGNPDKLIYATDYNGTVCNTGSNKGKPFIYYPELAEDLQSAGLAEFSALSTRGVCLDACPSKFKKNATGAYVQNEINLPWRAAAAGNFTVPYNTKDVFYRCLDDFHYYTLDVAQCLYFNSSATTITSGCSTGAVFNKGCVHKPCDKYKTSTLPGANSAVCTASGEFVVHPCEQTTGQTDLKHYTACQKAVKKSYPYCTEIAMGSASLTNQPKSDNPIYATMMKWGATIARWTGDLQLAAPAILLCGCVLAVGMGFLWIFLVQWITTLIVWATVALACAMMLGLALYCLAKGDVIASKYVEASEGGRVLPRAAGFALGSHAAAAKSTTEIWAICGWIFVGLLGVMVLVLVYLRSRIRLAIGMISEAGRAVREMPLMMFFPLVPVAMLLCLIVYWLWVAANLASIDGADFQIALPGANVTVGGAGSSVSAEDTYRYLLLYHFFGLLWTNQVIAGLQLMTVAGAVSRWYWKGPNEDINGEGGMCSPDSFVSPTFASFKRAVRYHLGSIAFGGLVITIIQMMRLVFEYICERTKALQGQSCVVRLITGCMRCLLWCLERVFKYITWNVYIVIAMQGCNFCAGTKEAYKLLSSNVKRIVTVHVMSAFVINLGRCMIVVTCTLAMFGLMEGNHLGAIFLPGTTASLAGVSSPVFPLLAVIVFSSVVADQFMDVFYMAIETIMLSFCSDVAMNGASKKYAMSESLRSFMNGDAKSLAFMSVNHVSDGAGHWKTVDEEEEKREI